MSESETPTADRTAHVAAAEGAVAAASREAMQVIEEREIQQKIPGFFYQRRNQR